MNGKNVVLFALCSLLSSVPVFASSGTEGAAFLDIPVGGGPAALGASYTALSNDAYAATYNPAGLGSLDSMQFSGQHLSYLDSLHYEYLSLAVPFAGDKGTKDSHSAIGASVQYLGSGDIDSTDNSGNAAGTFSSYYASYNLAYGHSVTDKLSLGLTGKLISAKIAENKASAYAADLGTMYKLQPNLTFAATLTNLGSPLTFLDQKDSLPMAFHAGAAYSPIPQWLITAEGVYPKTGLASFHAGTQWRPIQMISLRAGYRTDTVKELSALAGFSTGLGLEVWGQEIAYAFLPYGDLGSTHYLSLLMKFDDAIKAKRESVKYQKVKMHQEARKIGTPESRTKQSEFDLYEQLRKLLDDMEQERLARQKAGHGEAL